MNAFVWFSKDGTTPLFTLGAGTAVLVLLLRVYYGLRIRRLQRELALLAVTSGAFTEGDITRILGHVVSLEVQGDREGTRALLRLIAEKSTDPGTVRLAKSRLERLAGP
jgi:hypothetical protein